MKINREIGDGQFAEALNILERTLAKFDNRRTQTFGEQFGSRRNLRFAVCAKNFLPEAVKTTLAR